MKILISNDDGIFSPGLIALAEVGAKFGEVMICAPDVEQSAKAQAITITRPLQIHKVTNLGFQAWRVNGTPSDCVAMGLYKWGGADLVLSGINLGTNLGNDIWHSGTVAAAKQATLLGTRGFAFSQSVSDDQPDYSDKKPYIEEVIRMLLERSYPPRLVNVNLPSNPIGIRWTHQSVRAYNGKVIPSEDPMGRPHYWFSAVPLTSPDADSDRWAFDNGFVSVTPLRLDLTDESILAQMNG